MSCPLFFFSRAYKGGVALYVEALPPSESPALRESTSELSIRNVQVTAR